MTGTPRIGRDVLVVGGPTASGKSTLALDLARRFDGVVVNGDALQVYRDLRILSARPGPEEEAAVPHRLYGVLDGSERCTVARWRTMALDAIADAFAEGRIPVVAGGTGLYLRSLMQGIADIPDIPPEIRQSTAELHAFLGGEAFREELARRDPKAAARLHPGDRQRLVRAFEVMAATGRSIVDWQAAPGSAPDGLAFHFIGLMPPREVLYAACDNRFQAMLEEGALEEARALDARRLPPDLPVMKAVGVPELRRHLSGELPLAEASALARQSTRRYAKRQLTWFRHQAPKTGDGGNVHNSHTSDTQYSEKLLDQILSNIRFCD